MNLLKSKYIKYIAILILIIYLLYLIYLTLFSIDYGRGHINRDLNLIPFLTISHFFILPHNLKNFVINIFGNIAAFIPMGFLLPFILKKSSELIKTIFIILFATFAIETLQFITGVGASDIDDVILNFLGGNIGYFIYYCVKKLSIIKNCPVGR